MKSLSFLLRFSKKHSPNRPYPILPGVLNQIIKHRSRYRVAETDITIRRISLLLVILGILLPRPVLSDSSNIEFVERIVGGYCHEVAFSNNIVCAAFRSHLGSLFAVIDFSDAANPQVLYTRNFDFINGIEFKDKDVYVLERSGWLRVLDLSEPSSPVQTALVFAAEDGADLCFEGPYLYAAHGFDGLRVYDTSVTPPVAIGSYPYTGYSNAVAADGNYAYLTEYYSGLHIIDVSDPSNPVLTAMYDLPDGNRRVDVSRSTVYVTSSEGAKVIDVSNPTAPVEIGVVPNSTSYIEIKVTRSLAFLMDPVGMLAIVDIKTPSSPVVISTSGPYGGQRLTLLGRRAALAAGRVGVRLVDLSDPAEPMTRGTFESLGYPSQLVKGEDYLIMAERGRGILTVDSEDKSCRYRLQGQHNTAGPRGIAMSGNYVYVANYGSPGDNGLGIYDLTDPTAPVEVAWVPSGRGYSVCVDDNRAYYAHSNSLMIIDTSDPTNPVVLGSLNLGRTTVRGVAVDDDYAYLAAAGQGLKVVDISDPTLPVIVGSAAVGNAFDVAVWNGYAFFAVDYTGPVGMTVADVSDPTAPTLVASFDTDSYTDYIVVHPPYAYLSGRSDSRLWMVDISDPANPVEAGYYDSRLISGRVAVAPPYIYAISYIHRGLLVLRSDVATSIGNVATPRVNLNQNFPNPFNPVTTITYSIPKSAHVNLRIYDVRGRLITSLVNGQKTAGEHTATWNGEDKGGSLVASGVYFVRLESRGKVQTRKIVMLK